MMLKETEGVAQGGVSSFGHISDGAEHYVDHQTVNSTTNVTSQLNMTGGRPRIQSATRRPGGDSNMEVGHDGDISAQESS